MCQLGEQPGVSPSSKQVAAQQETQRDVAEAAEQLPTPPEELYELIRRYRRYLARTGQKSDRKPAAGKP